MFVKDSGNFHEPISTNATNFILIISYGGIVLNCSATITSLILIDKLGGMSTQSNKNRPEPARSIQNATSLSLLKTYRVGRYWKWAMWHCKSSLRWWGIFWLMRKYRAILSDHRNSMHHAADLGLYIPSGNNSGESGDDCCCRLCALTFVAICVA